MNLKIEKKYIKEFEKEQLYNSLFFYRLSILLCTFLWVIFGFLDIVALPESKNIAIFIRIIILPLIFVIILFLYTDRLIKYIEIIVSVTFLIAGLGIIAMLYFAKPNELGFKTYYAGLALILFYLFLFLRFRYASLTMLILIFTYFISIIFNQNTYKTEDYWLIFLNNTFFISSVIILGLLGSYVIEYFKKLNFIQKKDLELRNTKINFELNLAKKIQENILPQTPQTFMNLEVSSVFHPMHELGGDFYDLISIDENRIGIFIGDVSGHGVYASLITCMVKTIINTSGEMKNSPSKFLKFLNEVIVQQIEDHFLTAFYGIYDQSNKIFTFSRGGHNYPILIRENECIELHSSGRIIGMLKNQNYEESSIQLKAKDKIILFTDGIIESKNNKKKNFEDQFLLELKNSSKMNIHLFISKLFSKFLLFQGETNLEDDVCLVGVEVL